MFDLNAYRERCSELRLSEEKLQEVITMTEQNKNRKIRRPLRVGLIAAALCALTVISVSAAAPEMLEEIMLTIRASVTVGEYREELTMDTGEQVTALQVPEAVVEERDGRMLLIVDGEETDITEELKQDGAYLWEYEDEGAVVQVKVFLGEDGTPQTITTVAPAEGMDESGMVMTTTVTTEN